MDAKELLQQCIEQERTYTFSRFDRADVWDLGCALVAACGEMEGPLAVEIWLGGVEVFRYYPAGTGKFHEQWLARKRRTVLTLEKSSMRVKAELLSSGEQMREDMCLDPMEYAACGGGFPIRIQGGCVIGYIGVSGLADTRDHAALIAGLERFFQSKGLK